MWVDVYMNMLISIIMIMSLRLKFLRAHNYHNIEWFPEFTVMIYIFGILHTSTI